MAGPATCPHCGTGTPGSSFCTACGEPLSEDVPARWRRRLGWPLLGVDVLGWSSLFVLVHLGTRSDCVGESVRHQDLYVGLLLALAGLVLLGLFLNPAVRPAATALWLGFLIGLPFLFGGVAVAWLLLPAYVVLVALTVRRSRRRRGGRSPLLLLAYVLGAPYLAGAAFGVLAIGFQCASLF